MALAIIITILHLFHKMTTRGCCGLRMANSCSENINILVDDLCRNRLSLMLYQSILMTKSRQWYGQAGFLPGKVDYFFRDLEAVNSIVEGREHVDVAASP